MKIYENKKNVAKPEKNVFSIPPYTNLLSEMLSIDKSTWNIFSAKVANILTENKNPSFSMKCLREP